MNNRILSFFKEIMKKTADNNRPLGRWKIEYCVETLNIKIDLANEDNCGPCGQYINDKMKKNTNTK